MSIRTKGLVFAMEEDNVVPVEGELVSETAAEVEAGAAEMTQDAGEVEELQTAVEEAEADAETLGDIQEVMADSVEQGEGLDETAAEVAEIAVESICRRLGIRNADKVMPATESFGSKSSRVAATRIAMEGIGDKIKQIWEAIKAAFLRLWEKIKSFFIGVAKNTQALSKHLEGLKTRVQQLDTTKKPVDSELENESLAKGFSVKKKADLGTAKTILTNSRNLLKAAETLSAEVQASAEGVKALVSKAEVSDAEFEKFMNDGAGAVTQRIAQVLNTARGFGGEIKSDKKGKVDYYGPFAGCRALAVSDEMKGEGDNQFHTYRVAVTTVDSIAAKKIKALSQPEMLELLNEGIKLLDALEAHEKTQKSVEKIVEASKAAADVAIKEVQKLSEGNSAKGRVFRQVASEMNGINATVGALGVAIPKAVFDAIKLSGDYVSASIANYGEKKSK